MNDKERAQMDRKLDRLKARLTDNTEEVDRLLRLVKEAGDVKDNIGSYISRGYYFEYSSPIPEFNKNRHPDRYNAVYGPCFKDCGCTWSYTDSDLPSGVEFESEGICFP